MKMVYIYRCPRCHRREEVSHSINVDPVIRCRSCEHRPVMQRVLFPVGFRTHGEGFERRGRV